MNGQAKKNEKGRKPGTLVGFCLMAAAVALLTGLILHACNYLLVDDTQSYTRLTLHEFYELADRGENIDTLFLGSSHCFRAYDPALYTELTGENAYNLGSSSQNYDTSYYLLREAARYNDLQTVYLDMHYKFLFIAKKDRDLVQANIITDYMRFSANKLEFLLTTAEPGNLTNRIFPFRRNWQSLSDFSYLRTVAEAKQTDAYRDYEPVVLEQERYAGRGFVSSTEQLDADAITWWDNFDKIAGDMDSDETYTLEYIGRIVDFCATEGIELVFVTAPSFSRYLEAVGPYSQAHEYIQNLADAYGVSYLDFNLDTQAQFSQEYFLDVDHLNAQGAEALTRLLAEERQR